MDPNTLTASTLAGLAVVLALTELCKQLVPAKFWPMLAVAVAIGWTELAGYVSQPPAFAPLFLLAQGVLLGLSACGLYAAGKHVVSINSQVKES